MRPICCCCQVEMDCEKNGIIAWHPTERSDGNFIPNKKTGMDDIDFIIHCDKYKCPLCGVEILTGFGSPIINTYENQSNLAKVIKNAIQRGVAIRITRT